MGKRRTPNTGGSWNNASGNRVSLREESTGIKHGKGGHKNAKALLKHEYLTMLAVWAGGEANIPNLASFFGQRLAAIEEALGVPHDSSLISCQRCETILQPGFNCTIRIEKNNPKAKCRRKKPGRITKNNVVFHCNFCSHRNLMRGTPKGYLQQIYPPKAKPSAVLESEKPVLQRCADLEKDTTKKYETSKNDCAVLSSTTPLQEDTPQKNPETPLRTAPTLLDTKKRKRKKPASKRAAEPESGSAIMDADKTVSGSTKRKRKSWTTLKEIAENSVQNDSRNNTNLTIPFLI